MIAATAIENSCIARAGSLPGAASRVACALPIANLHSHPTRQKGPFQGCFYVFCVLCKLYSILTEVVIGQEGQKIAGRLRVIVEPVWGPNLHITQNRKKPLRHAALCCVGWGFIRPNTSRTSNPAPRAAPAYMSVHANGQSGRPVRSRDLPATSTPLPRQNVPAWFSP